LGRWAQSPPVRSATNVDLRYAFILAGCLCAFTVVMAFVAPYTKEHE
jgi:hypothetical protein